MKKYILILLLAAPIYGATVSDDFNRADQSLFASSNWSPDQVGTSSMVIVSNILKSTQTAAGGYYKARWIGASLASSDYWTEADVQVNSGEAVNTLAPAGRLTNGTGAANNDGYGAPPYVSDAFYLVRIDDGAETVLGTYGTPASATTYVIRLTCNGSSLVVKIDGTDRISTTDATYASGGVGIFNAIYTSILSQHFMDNWEASDIAAAAAPSISPFVLMLGD